MTQPNEHPEIAALFDIWNAALKTNDAAQVAALYAPDAILLPTLSDEVRKSSDAIRDYFGQLLAVKLHAELLDQNIRLFDTVAVNSGTYVFKLMTPDGPADLPCRFTFIYRRDADGWRIIEHHSSKMPELV